jgi:hypothetical protein
MLILAAGVAATALVGQQEPTIDYQVVAPDYSAPFAQATTEVAATQDTSVTLDFSNATVSSVLQTLHGYGFNYLISDRDIPEGTTITLSVKNQSVDGLANAIAAALGGSWADKGGVYLFVKNGGFAFAPAMPALEAPKFGGTTPALPPAVAITPPSASPFGQNLQITPKVFMDPFGQQRYSSLSPDQRKRLESELKKLRDILKDLPSKANRKSDDKSKVSPEEYRSFEKLLREVQQEIQSLEPSPFFEYQNITPRFQFTTPPNLKMAPDGQNWEYTTPNVKQFEFTLPKANGQTPFEYTAPEIWARRPSHFDELLKSLTQRQKDLQKSQGYLKMDDLTAQQKQMLGLKGAGEFEIHVKTKDGELTIKS